MKAVLEHCNNYSVNVWTPYSEKRDLDGLDGVNVAVGLAGDRNG